MPSLGADMAAGTLVEWLKHPGDAVRRGDIVAVVETDKGAIEVEIFEDGLIDTLLVAEGTEVPVGTPLATIVGSDGIGTVPASTPAPTPAPTTAPLPRADSVPATRPTANEAVLKAPVAAPLRASPAARWLAGERDIDLALVQGSGPGGAIQRADVATLVSQPKRREGIDLAQMRRAIAAAMARSKREIPHYYLSHSFDISAAEAFLADYNATRLPADRLLIAPLLIRATALALADYPEFNGFHDGDSFTPSEAIHIGFAIAIRGGGLAAPAIRDTGQLVLPELMHRLRDLALRVRRGEFRSSELSDPTVTISSLGERGVDLLLPVIYPPQVAIIGFGTIRQQPWVVGDRIEQRVVMTVTLGADHRANDGHRGALLLRRIAELLAEPHKL